jgi:hypothetical protein
MKSILVLTLALSLARILVSDELVLRSGEHIHGTYYGGSPRSVRFSLASSRISSGIIRTKTSKPLGGSAQMRAAGTVSKLGAGDTALRCFRRQT